jgi:hypothetical protein
VVIMEIDEMEVMEMELKYCERCGALWLRLMGSEGVYCGVCSPKMVNAPALRKSGGTRLRMSRDSHAVGCETRALAAMEGGRA